MQKRKEPDGKETSRNGQRGMGRMEGGWKGRRGRSVFDRSAVLSRSRALRTSIAPPPPPPPPPAS